MKVLVTGGAGFIGSHIVGAYVEAGHEVVVIDDLSTGHAENVHPDARLEQLDVASPEAAALVASERPDVLNHHAAQMNVRFSVEDPVFDARVNILGLINVVEAARKAGTRRVIFASSGGTVYGEPQHFPCNEDEPTHPVCPYGVSKLTGEHYLFYYRRVHGLAYTALRYSNVYGPRQDPHGEAGVVAIFCTRLLERRDVTIFGDGLQTRDYVFVGDVVRANLAALEADVAGAVNIGTGLETSVVTLYERIKALVGGDGGAEHAAVRPGEVLRSVLDASLAKRVLGWQPRAGLAEGLASTVDFFRARS